MVKLSLAEKREQFLVLMGMFLLGAVVLSLVLFYTDDRTYDISKEDLENRIQDDIKFEEAAQMTMKYIDSASRQINRFDPTIQAVFLENDIKKTLQDINAVYVRNDYDTRYTIFTHTAVLYDNYFVDRRELKGNLQDIERIKKSIDDCLLTRQQIQQALSTVVQ